MERFSLPNNEGVGCITPWRMGTLFQISLWFPENEGNDQRRFAFSISRSASGVTFSLLLDKER